MANSVSIGGLAGEIRWGYHQAAVLGSWTLSATPSGCSLTATVVSHDAFRMQQPSLTFRVHRQTTVWIWPVLELQYADGTLTASLGPQE